MDNFLGRLLADPSQMGARGFGTAQPANAAPTDGMALPDMMGGINDSLAHNQAQVQAQAQQRQQSGRKPENFLGRLMGAIADGLLTQAGHQPVYAPRMREKRIGQVMRNYATDPEGAIREMMEIDPGKGLELLKMQARPEIERVGNTLGMVDPAKRSYEPFYTAPEPFENYARSLGLQPGTPEYGEAIREYRAGTWNDQGVQGRMMVQQPRLDVTRENNERSTSTSRANNIRSTNASRANNERSTTTSRDNNIRSTGQSNANSVRTSETARRGQDLRSTIKGRKVGGQLVSGNEPMAKDAQGRPMVVRGGKWVVVE